MYELSNVAVVGCSRSPVCIRQPGRDTFEVIGVYIGERYSEWRSHMPLGVRSYSTHGHTSAELAVKSHQMNARTSNSLRVKRVMSTAVHIGRGAWVGSGLGGRLVGSRIRRDHYHALHVPLYERNTYIQAKKCDGSHLCEHRPHKKPRVTFITATSSLNETHERRCPSFPPKEEIITNRSICVRLAPPRGIWRNLRRLAGAAGRPGEAARPARASGPPLMA